MNRSNGQWFHELPSLMICFKSRQHHTHQSYCHWLQKILLNKVHLHDEMLRNPQPVFIIILFFWKTTGTTSTPSACQCWHLTFSIGADGLDSLIDWLIDWLLQLIMSNGGMVFLLIAYAIAIVSMTNQHNTTNSNLLCSIP